MNNFPPLSCRVKQNNNNKSSELSHSHPQLFTNCWNFTSQRNKLVTGQNSMQKTGTNHILGQQLTWMQWKTRCGFFYALEAGFCSHHDRKQKLWDPWHFSQYETQFWRRPASPIWKVPKQVFQNNDFPGHVYTIASHPPPPPSPLVAQKLSLESGVGRIETWAREEWEQEKLSFRVFWWLSAPPSFSS